MLITKEFIVSENDGGGGGVVAIKLIRGTYINYHDYGNC